MPRARKSAEDKRAEKKLDAKLSNFWTSRIRAGLEVRKLYDAIADEVQTFLNAKHSALYEDEGLATHFMSFKGSAQVSIPKTAQMKNSLAPRLYLSKPKRTVVYTGEDPVLLGLSRLLQAYLDYTAREANMAWELRRSVDDGLIRGRAYLRQGWDDVRKIIYSSYVSSKDVVFDPDFIRIQDAQWIAIRHVEPFWKIKRRIKQKWRLQNLERGQNLDEPEEKDVTSGATCYTVEWWEVLSKMGRGVRGADLQCEHENYADDEDFVRLEVVLGHRQLLAEGEWDVPLYLDRDWPLTYRDFVEGPDESYPQSAFGQVLSPQKVIDLLSSLRLGSCKNRDRTVLLCDKRVPLEAQEVLRHGTHADFLPMDIPAGQSIESVAKVLDFGVGSQESGRERDFLLREMETATGVTSILTGAADNAPQDRSATATNTRNDAAQTRVGDFKNKVEELVTEASRKEAIMVRLFLTEEDVVPFVRSKDLNLFYVRVEAPGQPPLPVRRISPEQKELTIQDVYPRAATYFEDPTAALMAAMEFWITLQGSLDPATTALKASLASMELDENGVPVGIGVDVVTASRVWRDTAGMTAEEIMRELSYEIASGSGIKFDKQAERENVNMLVQTLMPIMAQNMDYDGLNKVLAMRERAYDIPEDQAVRLKPPPPPPPQEGGGEEPKGEKKKGPPKK